MLNYKWITLANINIKSLKIVFIDSLFRYSGFKKLLHWFKNTEYKLKRK